MDPRVKPKGDGGCVEFGIVSERNDLNFKDWSPQHTRLKYESIISSSVFFMVAVFGYKVNLPFLEPGSDFLFEDEAKNKDIASFVFLMGAGLAAFVFNVSFNVRALADALQIPNIATSIANIKKTLESKETDINRLETLYESQASVGGFTLKIEPPLEKIADYFHPDEIAKTVQHMSNDAGQNFGQEWKTAGKLEAGLKEILARYPSDKDVRLMLNSAKSLRKETSLTENFGVGVTDRLSSYFGNTLKEFERQIEEQNKTLDAARKDREAFLELSNSFLDNGLKDLRFESEEIHSLLSEAGGDLKKLSFILRTDRVFLAWIIPSVASGLMFLAGLVAFIYRVVEHDVLQNLL